MEDKVQGERGVSGDQPDAQGDQPDARGDQPDARGDQSSARGQLGVKRQTGVMPSMKESDFVDDQYKMNHPDRGVAVIINNKNFHERTGMGTRNGTDVDRDGMYNLLLKMGFEKILVLEDVTVKIMLEELISVSKENHVDNDCFVCVILSHGEEGYVFGVDDKIQLDVLVAPFKGDKCLSLAGKPKLFFIQACRGTKLDAGVEVSDAGPTDDEEMEVEVVMRSIPTESDFLMAYSVVSGYYAWRNSSKGSWFIQAIVEVFNEHRQSMDLLTMMTRVNKKVAYNFQSSASKEYMTKKKQIPCITSMLTKDVFFKK